MRPMTAKKMALVLAVMMIVCTLLSGCQQKTKVITSIDELPIDYNTSKTIFFEIVMEDGNVMEGELYPKIAPITVRNFVTLAESGYYDGVCFGRTVDDVLIQTTGGAEGYYCIRAEVSKNGWNNTIDHDRGVISMARKTEYDTAYSSFFILLDARRNYNGEYAAFGKITSGLKYADEYSRAEGEGEYTTEEIKIKTINILGN